MPRIDGFILTYDEGKQVQEIMRRYVSEELEPRTSPDSLYYEGYEGAASIQKDIDYIQQLTELFED